MKVKILRDYYSDTYVALVFQLIERAKWGTPFSIDVPDLSPLHWCEIRKVIVTVTLNESINLIEELDYTLKQRELVINNDYPYIDFKKTDRLALVVNYSN